MTNTDNPGTVAETASELTTLNGSTLFNDDMLAGLSGYKDAAAMLDASGVAAESVADYGTGFRVVDKATLIGVPFLILEWRFNEGDYARGFVSVAAITKHDDKVIFNDGSTGVRDQLATVTKQRIKKGHAHPTAGLICENGLSRTTYYANSKTGETSSRPQDGADWGPASTFYLAD
jgi:hypothetical protein